MCRFHFSPRNMDIVSCLIMGHTVGHANQAVRLERVYVRMLQVMVVLGREQITELVTSDGAAVRG